MTTTTRMLAGALCALIGTTVRITGAEAQSLTADKAVQIALKHNSQVVTSAADVLDARASLNRAASGTLPTITGSAARSGSFEDNNIIRSGEIAFVGGRLLRGPGTIDTHSYQTTPAISGSWNVLDLSALTNVRAARNGVAAAELTREATRHDVVLDTRRRFYDVVTSVHLAAVATGALRVARDDERRVRALFEVGSVSRSDVLKAQVRTEQSELDSLTAAQNITNARILLAEQIGVAESELGAVDTSLTAEPRDYDEAALIAEAMRRRPDLIAADRNLRAANAALASAHLARMPYVSVGGSLTFSPLATQSFRATAADAAGVPVVVVGDSRSESDRLWRGQVAVNMNLFTGLLTESRIGTARAQQIRAREARDALRRNLASEVHGVLLAYQSALERERVARRSVESAAEDLNLTQQKYNVGSATILELVDAEVQLQRAQSDAVSALAALRVAEAQIERVRGSGQ